MASRRSSALDDSSSEEEANETPKPTKAAAPDSDASGEGTSSGEDSPRPIRRAARERPKPIAMTGWLGKSTARAERAAMKRKKGREKAAARSRQRDKYD
ncbi:unnamed protein product, partial [Chrysoparadoxa australica]